MANKKSEPKDYRAMAAELDAILEALQKSDLDIDEAVQAYTHGMEIVEELEKYLQSAENKVTKIKKSWSTSTEK
jgi:exodeoxyribonuclease VII small subunit